MSDAKIVLIAIVSYLILAPVMSWVISWLRGSDFETVLSRFWKVGAALVIVFFVAAGDGGFATIIGVAAGAGWVGFAVGRGVGRLDAREDLLGGEEQR